MAIALYPGAFKPPHRGHFELVKSLINNNHNGRIYNKSSIDTAVSNLGNEDESIEKIDKVIIFLGGGERNGISLKESKAVWDIYLKHLPGVEVIVGGKNPMLAAKDYAKENPNQTFYAVTGFRDESDVKDLARITTFKNRPNVKGLVVSSRPENLVRATDFRKALLSGNLDEVKDFFPKELSNQEILKIIDMLKQSIISEIMQEDLDSTINGLFNLNKSEVDYKLDIAKFNQKKSLPQLLSSILYEIKLSKDNAVGTDGDLTGGIFKVGDIEYEYRIKSIPNPYEDSGLFYNIQFTPRGESISTPTQTVSPKDYIKILSTMYKIISDFAEKKKPEYIGIGSLDNSGSKNYHLIYNALTDPKNNHLPNYFRKDVNLPFNTPEQGQGRFTVLKRKKKPGNNKLQKEGSSGAPVAPSSAIRSSDRSVLVRLYNRLINMIGDNYYNIDFNQDHIRISTKGKDNSKFDYTPYMGSILEYMIEQGMKIQPLPEIKVKRDLVEASDFFGKTAYYRPDKKEVVVYTQSRHPKDVMRSFTHEMIHHMQNLEGRLGGITTSNTNESNELLEIEKEAYLLGNITFRNWEDKVKNTK